LKADVDADGARTWQATIVGSILTITTDGVNINVSGLANLTEGDVYSLVATEAELAGLVVAPENTVTSFIITVAGVVSTTNLVEYSVGSEVETDEVYLERILVSQQQGGGGTLASIEDAVGNLAGVTAVSVYDNKTLIVDADGRPGKSFEVIAQGGLDTELAQLIWDKHPAGIETYGLTSLPVTDSNGDPQTVFFTRPVAVNFAFRVSYTLYDEEVFPGGGDLAIRDSIVETTAGLGVGKDVISTRFYGGAYASTTGVSITAVEFQRITTPGDTPGGGSWTTVTDEIDIREFASTTLVDVTTVVT
ncbi:MAG: baseplate J/gp47 family protein, partial [Gammaproteobacteria bacterium]|nr:baseplate J/gp47 family protein [Gammaproteobacteria bacterium]